MCRHRTGVMTAFCEIRSWILGTYPASRCRCVVVDVSAGSHRQRLLSVSPNVCHILGDHKFSTLENVVLLRFSDKNTYIMLCTIVFIEQGAVHRQK